MQIECENDRTFITCETEIEKAKKASSKTLSDTIKKVFPERHVHELRYTFISRCKECVQNGNLKIIIASK